MRRRQFLASLAALGVSAPLLAAESITTKTRLGAAWRGPQPGDPYYAGMLVADWANRRLSIRYALRLPTRPHGLVAEPDGGLLVCGVRPGGWLLRCDGEGKLRQQVALGQEGEARLNGHAVYRADAALIYTTETDGRSGQGLIGVREAASLKKIAEWPSGGLEPHQLLLDDAGRLMVANGGIPRTAEDKKYDLSRMDSSLVCMDGETGAIREKWTLPDRRLSLRHLAWAAHGEGGNGRRLGVAMQAEHDDPASRAGAPSLAVLEGGRLLMVGEPPTGGGGYAGDIAPVWAGGFAVSNNQAGLALGWRPASPGQIQPLVQMEETYALAPWADGPSPGGLLVATAPGLIRWHPTEKPLFLAWPQPMALDNHWVSFPAA